MGIFDFLGDAVSIITFVLFIFGVSQISEVSSVIPIVNSNIFKIVSLLVILLISILLWVREIHVDGQYRIKNHKITELDLKMSKLKGDGESLFFFLMPDDPKSRFLKLLVCFRFKFLIVIRYPTGIMVNHERCGTDFIQLSKKPNELILIHELDSEGRRYVDLTIIKEAESSFSGDSSLKIDAYISIPHPVLKSLCFYLIGSRCSTNIKIST